MPTVDDVEAALTNVIDPELGLDFVELGLIYGIEVSEGDVHVTYTLTTPACPIGPMVAEQIEEFVSELDGVDVGRVLDDLHPAVVPGEDVRGREVRARLLDRPHDGSGAAFSPWARPRACDPPARAAVAGAGRRLLARAAICISSAIEASSPSAIVSMSGSAS